MIRSANSEDAKQKRPPMHNSNKVISKGRKETEEREMSELNADMVHVVFSQAKANGMQKPKQVAASGLGGIWTA